MSSSQTRLRSLPSNDPALALYSQVQSIISTFSLGRDACVFTVTDSHVRVEKCSGRFEAFTSLPKAFESLCNPLALKIGSAAVVEIDESARKKLSFLHFPDGMLAVVVLQKSEQGLLCAAVFESRSNGLLGPDEISAFQSVARLISTHAPSREVTQTREFYRRFSHAIRQCFWIVEQDTSRILTVSDNFEEVWGASRSILTSGSISGFMANVLPEDRDRVLAEFHTHLESDELDLEFRVQDLEGEIRWVWLRMSRFEDESPDRLLLMIADDITDKKQAEERERSQEVALVSKARALAVVDLASGVAHEINNPLTIIVGRAAELRRKVLKGDSTPEAQIEAIDKISNTALRIADIVKSLKSLARQDRGAGFQPTPFVTLAHEIADLSLERFKAHETALEIVPPPDGLMAEMNPTLISQAILNLANNALDAVSELKDRWVRVEFTDDADSVYISVTDSGAGIPIKIRSRIFDPFFTTKAPNRGTGLGLSLSMSIAAHHDGVLRLDTLHAHTRFVLQIPKKQSLKAA
jgi:PAS domain S-box-containing protein